MPQIPLVLQVDHDYNSGHWVDVHEDEMDEEDKAIFILLIQPLGRIGIVHIRTMNASGGTAEYRLKPLSSD